MSYPDDPRLSEAKAIPMTEMVDRLGIQGLKAVSGELVGPCPLCCGHDRFAINLRTGRFLCRKCDIRGGDQIALTMQVLNVDFPGALKVLAGERRVYLDPTERKRRQKRAAEVERKQREADNRYRRSAITAARTIWNKARPGKDGIVGAYLAARGIAVEALPGIPDALRFIVDHPYVKKIDGQFETLHRGPCMVAGIQAPDGALTAVHQTWVDVTPPHGKAEIVRQGEAISAKLVRGSKKSGAIRLHTPDDADTLVMGEGIETTLSVLIANPFPNAAYWAGVDLGNMAGRMERVTGKRYSGLPDMGDTDAFVPPPWVRRLVFLMDGDSKPGMTHAKLTCGLTRAMAMRAGLQGQIMRAGDGVDFNDLLGAAALDEASEYEGAA